jgi:hypothetical protein
MDKPDLNAIAQRMVEGVRSFVAKSEAALNRRIEDLANRLDALPPAQKGEKGDTGIQGKDIDPAEVTSAIQAAVALHVAALPPAKPGDPGKDGPVGPMGERGEPGPPGALGINGKDGAQGIAGKDGAAGIRGEAGEPGRDAAALEILPSIDDAKSYRRGTWASHNGGLIRAARQTDAVKDGAIVEAGWVVMVEGIAAVVVTQGDDPRAIEIAAMLTSGTKVISALHIPMVIDRGVWREGPHAKGDHVTWDGSGWIAQKTTTDKPGTSDAWRLSTKRGRDGKDGAVPAAVAREPVRLR